jgi:hypothetical protein
MNGDFQMTDESNESNYPGVEGAQMFVIPSYQFMLSRLEAVDSRLHTLVAFVATVTLAIPTIGRALNSTASFTSAFFLLAIGLALLAIALGVVVRVRGAILLPDPLACYNEWHHLSKWEFQRDALYFAGQHYHANRDLIHRKAKGVFAMSLIFLAELACLLLWVLLA